MIEKLDKLEKFKNYIISFLFILEEQTVNY